MNAPLSQSPSPKADNPPPTVSYPEVLKQNIPHHLTLSRWPKLSYRIRLRRLFLKRFLFRVTLVFAYSSKRILDVVGSFAALAMFGPIMLVTCLAIFLEDGGPVFFFQKRIGQGGKPFYMFKFRSMLKNAEALKKELLEKNAHGKSGTTFKMQNDPRITRVGRFIRKYSLDEFPQFMNVLKGDMSLVGPRPALPQEVKQYAAWQLRRLHIKPGITCLWQIKGRSDINFEGQVRLDLEYIGSESLIKDIVILLKTVPAVISGRGSY